MPKITTNERLAIMETKFNGLNKTVEDGFDSLRGDIRNLSSKFDCLDKKYATKESLQTTETAFDRRLKPVERIAYTTISVIVLAVLGALLGLVIK